MANPGRKPALSAPLFSLNPDEIPYVCDEAAGDLEVWRGEVLIAAFPWHSHSHPAPDGELHVFDATTGRLVRTFERGTWTKVANRNR